MADMTSSMASPHEGFEIVLNAAGYLSYAMQQNDVPVFHDVRIRNGSLQALSDLVLRITTAPAVTVPAERPLSPLASGAEVVVSDLAVRIERGKLAEQVEREIGELRVELLHDGSPICTRTQRLEILAANEWSGGVTFPELLAAFILPNQPVVEQLLAEARDLLRASTGDPALAGYQNAGPGRVLAQAAAVYGALARRGITYANPPASFETGGQKIRFPDQIVENRLGTCLDLAALYAGCLEQAGLQPLVVVLNGHAFVAVWLRAETFPTSVIDDPAALRKRIDLGVMVAVEATAFAQTPPLAFRAAQDAGRRHLADCVPGGSERMLVALDVKMARQAGIHPLPFSGGRIAADPAAPSAPSSQTDMPADLIAVDALPTPRLDDAAAAAKAEDGQQRLERWKRRLLDLTRRNRLLNFRETKSALRLQCPDLARLEDALSQGEEFIVLPRPALAGADDPRAASASSSGGAATEAQNDFLCQQLARRRLHTACNEQELETRLLGISRLARVNLEETGANTLFVALGFLRWYETPTDEQTNVAPILLVPLRIERHAVHEGFRIRMLDDEARINVTLLQKLESDFKLTIPGLDPLPQDAAGLDVADILGRLRSAVKDMPRWDVIEDACICVLTFAKFLVWLDLEQHADNFRSAPIARHLIETPTAPLPATDAVPDVESLDASVPPSSFLCPLDADASQIGAIVAAASGQSYVLEGPPGTGKSQTITNLIVHCLAHGKRVLFVAEKAAALDVVHKRLAASGVAPFCLSLHSTKTTREELRGQLDAALRVAGRQSTVDWEAETRRLEELRAHLNAYVEALHRPRNIGRSIHWAVEQLVHLRDAPRFRLAFDPAALDAGSAAKVHDAAVALRLAAGEAGDVAAHPLREFRASMWTLTLPAKMSQAIEALSAQIPTLESAAASVLEGCGLGRAGWSSATLAFGAALVACLAAAPALTAALVENPDWHEADAALRVWLARGRGRDARRLALLAHYRESVLAFESGPALAALQTAQAAWFPRRWLLRLRARQAIELHRRERVAGQWVTVQAELEHVAAVRQETAALAAAGDPARLFGATWNRGEAPWDKLTAALDWVRDFRTLIDRQADPVQRAAWLKRALVAGPGAPGDAAAQTAFLAAQRRFRELQAAVEADFGGAGPAMDAPPDLSGAIWGDPHAADCLGSCRAVLTRWRAGLPRLRAWCQYRLARDQAVASGLAPLVVELEAGRVAAAALEDVFSASFAETWLLHYALPQEPCINTFAGVQQHACIARFRQVDVAVRDITREVVNARLAARIPQVSAQTEKTHSSELGKISRFVRGGRATIRRIFQECPQALAVLKPCMLMSPLSVAQFLGGTFPRFDLVVFDEASQMPVWDAIGAVARGNQLVVVGDTKQLPPTNFFERKESDDAADLDVEDLESILDECAASRFPTRALTWHYRSRHESLIAFSNRLYYGNNLQTFPSPETGTQHLGVSWREVTGGVYDAGRTRTNRAEAEAVVQETLQRLADPGRRTRSIGIVTFSMQQQTLVEDLLEKARHEHPELDPFFDHEATEEPVFVKNLETVQGDERDVILFSICYGPDASGRVVMNFGPLNNTGGERRLNVAVTRARRQLIVFSTLRPEQIDLAKTQATGVVHLRAFLEFAQRSGLGEEATGGSPSTAARGHDGFAIGQAVATALEQRGWRVDRQVGCSSYRIDLAVRHPQRADSYLLGIEFDGSNYRSAKTARDRDRLRGSVLSGLGWRLHRVWASDWWQEPEREAARIEAVLKEALDAPPLEESPAPVLSPATAASVVRPAATPIVGAALARIVSNAGTPTVGVLPPGAAQYVRADFKPTPFPRGDEQAMLAELRRAVAAILSLEAPLREDRLLHIVAGMFGSTTLREGVRRTILATVPAGFAVAATPTGRRFFWVAGQAREDYHLFRVPLADDDEARPLADIAPEEMANAMRQVLARNLSLAIEDFYRETSLLFGCRRLTAKSKEYLAEGLEHLIAKGGCTEEQGLVRLAQARDAG